MPFFLHHLSSQHPLCWIFQVSVRGPRWPHRMLFCQRAPPGARKTLCNCSHRLSSAAGGKWTELDVQNARTVPLMQNQLVTVHSKLSDLCIHLFHPPRPDTCSMYNCVPKSLKSECEVSETPPVFFLLNDLPTVFSRASLLGPVDRPPYRVCRLRAPCRLMLMGMLNDLRGEAAFKNMPHSYLGRLPAPSMYIHLTSCSLSESQMSSCQQLIASHLQQAPVQWRWSTECCLFTGELPGVYQGSKVSATAPSSLVCVSIETATGKAGRMLMASQWAREAQLHAAICRWRSWINLLLISHSLHGMNRAQ